MAVRNNLISFQLNRRENNIELLPLDLLRNASLIFIIQRARARVRVARNATHIRQSFSCTFDKRIANQFGT